MTKCTHHTTHLSWVSYPLMRGMRRVPYPFYIMAGLFRGGRLDNTD
jgi:hypothetical protein